MTAYGKLTVVDETTVFWKPLVVSKDGKSAQETPGAPFRPMYGDSVPAFTAFAGQRTVGLVR